MVLYITLHSGPDTGITLNSFALQGLGAATAQGLVEHQLMSGETLFVAGPWVGKQL